MGLLNRLLRPKKKKICQEDLVKPFCLRAKQALLDNDLTKAIAYLDCGIRLAPERLQLYLERAQIFQYGLENYTRALEDYRFILLKLEAQPDHDLAEKCKQGMRDMMNPS